jgi:hypothetical protein
MDPRKQDLEAWLERAEKHAEWSFPREGKRVGVFSEEIEETFGGDTGSFRRVVRVTERTIDRHGQRLLVPEITVEGWWTTLAEVECPDEKVIALYCDHATSEQFHSEFKTDLDIERCRRASSPPTTSSWRARRSPTTFCAGSGSWASSARMRRSGTRRNADASGP